MVRVFTKRTLAGETAEVPAPVSSDLQEWQRHPRLRRHARKLRLHPDPASVLEKYASKAQGWSRKALLRHTCHVGAWVALLPVATVTKNFGVQGLSAVSLLAQLLRLCGKGRLTAWLRGILLLVAERLRELDVAQPQAEGSIVAKVRASCWTELKRSMPTQVIRHSGSTPPLPSAQDGARVQTEMAMELGIPPLGAQDGDVSIVEQKRCRLLNNTILCWMNYDIVEREANLTKLEEAFATIQGRSNFDARTLRNVLLGAAAALTPPRARPQLSEDPKEFHGESLAQFQTGAALQRRTRRLLLQAIKFWMGSWIENHQIELALEHVRGLIKKFETHTGDVAQACAGKQWQRLKGALVGVSSSAPIDCSFNALRRVQKAPVRISQTKNVGLFDIIKAAVGQLGGQATSVEVKAQIREMPEVASLSTEVYKGKKGSTDRGGGCRPLLWEHKVATHMAKLLDPVLEENGAQRKRGGAKVWKLQRRS